MNAPTLRVVEDRADERSCLRVVDQHGETCWRAGHVPGCSGMAGGDHELLPGWVSMEIDGQTVEVEIDA